MTVLIILRAAMAGAVNTDVFDDSVNVTSSSSVSCMDVLIGSSTSNLMAVASAGEAEDNADNNNSSSAQQQAAGRGSSMSSVASLLNRRNKAPVTATDASANVVPLHDVRKFVFQAPARSDKRIMASLRAHTFTSQTFISSFAVGLAIGSILAIIIKLLTEVGYRVLPYH